MTISGASLNNFHDTVTAQRAGERTFLSYSRASARGCTFESNNSAALHDSVSSLYFQVHKNDGVLVEKNLISLPPIMSGTHTGDDAGVYGNAHKDRVASISAWDGTVTASGHAVDFTSAAFIRIEDGVVAQHWDAMDYVASSQSFSLLAKPSGLPHSPLQHAQSTR